MTQECVFCQIVKGKLPCHKVYEDEEVLAILNHRPINPGHTLIIPKEHYKYITDCPRELFLSVMSVSQRISQKILETAEDEPMNTGLIVHGHIPHVHIHVFPQYDWDDITSRKFVNIKDGQIVFDHSLLPFADDEEQRIIAQKLNLENA